MLLLLACTSPKDTSPSPRDSEKESSPPDSHTADDTTESAADSDLHPIGEPLVIIEIGRAHV